jgi:dTDP-4-amino-4,6-dideoxygalactose transaminase
VSSCWLYNVHVADDVAARSLIAALVAEGIEARSFWRSLSTQVPWREMESRLAGVSRALSGTVVSLPSSSSLTEAEQAQVIEVLRAWRAVGSPPA